MPVSRVQGDLLDQRVDVIVYAWNRNYIPWWLLLPQGVSGAIKRKGGVKPFREVGKHGVMKAGDAVLTSAGRLPFKAIIHVAALEWYWRASEKAVANGVRNALELAKQKDFSSIAFPALGSGTGGMSIDRSLHLIEQSVNQASTNLDVLIVEFKSARK